MKCNTNESALAFVQRRPSLLRQHNDGKPSAATRALVIVAHPEDEILWVGGMIMMHPNWNWRIVSVCQDINRTQRSRFLESLQQLGSSGFMVNMSSDSKSDVFGKNTMHNAFRSAMENTSYDVLITHSPLSESRQQVGNGHVGEAALSLWQQKELKIGQMWMFAYANGDESSLPRAIETADIVVRLASDMWNRKCDLLRQVYHFTTDSLQVRTAPATEAFWYFDNSDQAMEWYHSQTKIKLCTPITSS